MSKRKSNHKVKLKNTGKGNEETKNFSTDKKTVNEIVKKSGGIITRSDIKDIFNIK
jgi:hypothetical protein